MIQPNQICLIVKLYNNRPELLPDSNGIAKLICMSKARNFSEIAPNIAFPEFNFYELYYSTFEKSELGRIKKLLPLREMAENFGLVRKSMRPKLGRKSFFTPEGKVALMFLKMYTGLSCPKLMEQLNGNIHYQIFCDVIIDPTRPLTNYKMLDDIMMELAGKLKIQQLQGILADKWRPYMENLDTMYTDAAAMEGSFGTQKEHYDLRRVKARTKRTEILYIFFGIHTANVVQLADRIEQRARLAAA